jgi:hypothetical protein
MNTQIEPDHQAPRTHSTRLAYLGILARLFVLFAALLPVLAFLIRVRPGAAAPRAEHVALVVPTAEPIVPSERPATWTWQDHAQQVEAARVELEQAHGERLEEEAQIAKAEAELATRQERSRRIAAEIDALLKQVHDAGPRLAHASSVLAEQRKASAALEARIGALAKVPKPRAKPLIDKSPVSRPPRGDEFHFELRDGRVSFIDMDELIDRLKADARIQMRMQSLPRPVTGEAGPVGDFAIRYQLVPVGLGLSGRYGGSVDAEYTLSGWEIVPVREKRGETLKSAFEPASDFRRAVNRLDPDRDTITLWVYPDAFEIFRQLRDLLNQAGFMVAARPLPIDMPIRGSPTGSVSAAQ